MVTIVVVYCTDAIHMMFVTSYVVTEFYVVAVLREGECSMAWLLN